MDLCLTTAPDNISVQGVIRTGLSDHDIIYMVRNLNHFQTNRHKVIQKRCLKHFGSLYIFADVDFLICSYSFQSLLLGVLVFQRLFSWYRSGDFLTLVEKAVGIEK